MPRIRDSNNDAKISNAGRYVFSPFWTANLSGNSAPGVGQQSVI